MSEECAKLIFANYLRLDLNIDPDEIIPYVKGQVLGSGNAAQVQIEKGEEKKEDGKLDMEAMIRQYMPLGRDSVKIIYKRQASNQILIYCPDENIKDRGKYFP